MNSLFQFILLCLLVMDMMLLWSGRIFVLIRISAVQGFLISILLLLPLNNMPLNTEHIFLALAVCLLKGIGFPFFLRRICRKLGIAPTTRPRFGRFFPVIAGLVSLAFALWIEKNIPVSLIFPPFLLPVALTTLFFGLILIVGCSRAFTQIIGYLIAENGIFILGIPLLTEGSVWFELSILLDVFAAIFVMTIAINHIKDTFDSINVVQFRNLRD